MNIFSKLGLFLFELKTIIGGRSTAYTQLELGEMYFHGRDGIKGLSPIRYQALRDFKKAFKWYKRAAEYGVIEAQSILGDIYRYDADAYSESELADIVRHRRAQYLLKAFELYSSTAEQGDISAQYALGNMYLNGEAVEKNVEKAFLWHKKAADSGYPYAQSALGAYYSKGVVVPKDSAKALEWYSKAKDTKNMCSVYFSSTLDLESTEVKERCELAITAGNLGCPDAQYDAGIMARRGHGVKQNLADAFNWFEKAANQGHYNSLLAVSSMYYLGAGVKRDEQKAACKSFASLGDFA